MSRFLLLYVKMKQLTQNKEGWLGDGNECSGPLVAP